MMANKINLARQAIMDSSYLVCLQGHNTSMDCGCMDYRDSNVVYDIEEKYGYSSEEMFHASFYNTRPEQFFKYYKQEILEHTGSPGDGPHALAELEKQGILKCVVTREIFSLARRGGCKNVVELHGSVFSNMCSHCRKEYPLEYVKTEAAEEIEKADVLLLLDCSMNQKLVTTHLKYFEGNKVILINPAEHFTDTRADIVIHGKVSEILPKIVYGEREDDEK